MKNMSDYNYKLYWYKYTILRRLIQDRRCGTKRPKLKTMKELKIILSKMEGATLRQLRDLHQAYLY